MKKLYIVYVHITPEGMHYYGVTYNVEKRWRCNGILYRGTTLQPFIEKYGWENIQHKVLYENLSYDDALKIEDSLILSGREKGNCINKHRSGSISKKEGYRREYREQNKDIIKERDKKYREQNKDIIKERNKKHYEQHKDKKREYYEQHKDKIKSYQSQYIDQHKDKIKERSKQYYEDNREKILEYQRQYREKNREKNNEYRQKNREKINEYQREYNKKNREKINEYYRQYRQKKKLEKQLKEVETTPLF